MDVEGGKGEGDRGQRQGIGEGDRGCGAGGGRKGGKG